MADATGHAHAVGSGENAHEWAHHLRALVDLEDDAGGPLTITVEKPLTAHGQRLADSLGVRVEVNPVTSQATSGRSMGSYILPGPSFAKPDGPRVDWIDYRASIARAHRREQNGDEPLTCPGCGTETDVTEIVHSPKCSTLAPPVEKRASAWTQDEVIAAFKAHAELHGETPSLDEWRIKAPGRPTQAVVVQLFGSWLDGVRAAGLEPRKRGRPKRTADADAREEAAAVLREIHALQARREDGDSELPVPAAPGSSVEADETTTLEGAPPDAAATETTVRSRAGAGPAVKWTREIILDLIRLWAEQHDGQPPTSSDWQAGDRAWPTPASCKRQFGSFANAIEAAGFEKPTRGRRRGKLQARPAAVEERAVDVVGVAAAARSSSVEATSEERESVSVGAGRSRSSDADLAVVRTAALHAVNAIFDLLEQVEQALA